MTNYRAWLEQKIEAQKQEHAALLRQPHTDENGLKCNRLLDEILDSRMALRRFAEFERETRSTVVPLTATPAIPRNWNRDGWTTLDWDTVELYSRSLSKTAIDLDNRVGGGGGEFTPHELLDLADRADAAAKRLRDLAKSYI